MSKTPKGKPGLLQAQGYHFNSYNPELNKTLPAEVKLAKFNNTCTRVPQEGVASYNIKMS